MLYNIHILCPKEGKHRAQAATDLDAHPDGDGQSNNHEQYGENDQNPAARVNDIVRILQSCKEETHVICGLQEVTHGFSMLQM